MEIQANQLSGQGTRLSEKNPWETYGAEMDLKLTPEMEKAVAEYATRVYDEDKSSSQTREELAMQKEFSDETAKEYQWLTADEYADVEQRIGTPMHSSTFINTLRQIGVRCWYAQHPQAGRATLLVSRNAGGMEREVGCWVQLGMMPELSIMRFDEHHVPLDERMRGWRTCTLQLILKSILTEEQVNRSFGKPRQTAAYDRYNRTLQQFRNAGGRLAA